jgi:hypothetical protein
MEYKVGTGSLSSVNRPAGNSNLSIGERVSGGTIPFNGKIDEVRICNVARTQAQILSNMNIEFCQAPSNLEAYYKMNEGVANATSTSITTISDDSGNSNLGTLTNFN